VRAAWRVEVSGRLGASRLVFVDEMGSNTSLSPLYGWSRVGERLRAAAPKNWGKNVTLISSMTHRGMGASVAVEGATTRAVFEAYVEQALVPNLSPGQVVIMDNLSVHKGGRVRELVEGAGCELMYLPPYSPDMNPIEEAFSKVKGSLRKAQARTRGTLIEAMGPALAAVSPLDARGFFEHRGYRAATDQPF
jgi:transposase